METHPKFRVTNQGSRKSGEGSPEYEITVQATSNVVFIWSAVFRFKINAELKESCKYEIKRRGDGQTYSTSRGLGFE